MVVFLIFGAAPVVLVLALAGLVWLSWVEVRAEPMSARMKLWWCSFVLLVNIPAYLILRFVVGADRRARAASDGAAGQR